MPREIFNPFDRSDLVRASDGMLWYGSQPETYLEVLESTVYSVPSNTAVIDGTGDSLNYEQLWDRAARVAGGLRASGVISGDRVVIDLESSLSWVVALLGTLLAGAVVVPIDQRAGSLSQRAVLADCDPRFVIGPMSPAPTAAPYTAPVEPDDLAQMLYTSGTTGEPKGVMATQRNLAAFGEITRRVLDVDMASQSRLRNLVAMPLCHAAGCNAQLLPTLALGGTVLLTRSLRASDIVDVAVRHEADTMLSVPAVYKLMTQREPEALKSLGSLRRLIYCAAPIAESLIRELRRLLPHAELSNAYGMTEISNMVLFLPSGLALSHRDSVGFAVPGVEIELRDEDGNGQGELYFRGPNMARGYWHKPELTAATFGSGWVQSGDIAALDIHGLVYLRDRANDVINRGGEKIFTVQVENSLLSHPDVEEATVIPFPDDVMGEKVGAVVVVRSGRQVSEADLLAHVAKSIPKYGVPERLLLRTEPLPRASSGKVLKAELRREVGWANWNGPAQPGP